MFVSVVRVKLRLMIVILQNASKLSMKLLFDSIRMRTFYVRRRKTCLTSDNLEHISINVIVTHAGYASLLPPRSPNFVSFCRITMYLIITLITSSEQNSTFTITSLRAIAVGKHMHRAMSRAKILSDYSLRLSTCLPSLGGVLRAARGNKGMSLKCRI